MRLTILPLALTIFALGVTTADASSRSARSKAQAKARTHASFDGAWTVRLATSHGTCGAFHFGVRVAGGRLINPGGGFSIAGSVSRSGSVRATLSSNRGTAHASGRLSPRGFGHGRWHTAAGECSGAWSAQRGR